MYCQIHTHLCIRHGVQTSNINNGDVEGAHDIIKVNSNALEEQLELGVKGIEHAAMLNILAHLHLTLGYFEEMEHLLIEVSFLLMVIS
jgi:hypothetical protein